MNTALHILNFLINHLSVKELISLSLAFFSIVEEIFIRVLRFYPYRYGLLVRKIMLSEEQMTTLFSGAASTRRTLVKVHGNSGEAYLRFRYPSLSQGPVVFVGHVASRTSGVLDVRIGIATALFLLSVSAYPFLDKSVGPYDFVNLLLVAGFLYWSYLHFLTCIPGKGDIGRILGI